MLPGVITYLVAVPPGPELPPTPIQEFSPGVLGLADAISGIAVLPANVSELFHSWSPAARARGAGLAPLNVSPVRIETLRLLSRMHALFCVVGQESTDDAIATFSAQSIVPILHLTTAASSRGIKRIGEATRRDFFDWLVGVRQRMAGTPFGASLDSLPWATGFVEWPPVTDSYVAREHNVTLPNELAMIAFERHAYRTEFIPVITSTSATDVDAPYVAAIRESAERVATARDGALGNWTLRPGTVSLIVATPSVSSHFQGAAGRQSDRHVRQVAKYFERQEHYPQFYDDGKRFKDVVTHPLLSALVELRRKELHVFTAVLAAMSASSFAPVIRLTPNVNRVSSLVLRLAGVLERPIGVDLRAHRLAQDIGEWLRARIHAPLLAMIEQSQNGIKLVGDAPLEWLSIRGLPLAMRQTTSRLPGTPGDLLVRAGVHSTKLFVSKRDILKVLVIRSFGPDDPTRHLLTLAVTRFAAVARDAPLDIAFVDVSSESELRAALNSSDAKIAILDCHGSHAPNALQGALQIGTDRVNPGVWDRGVRVPPIVILAACETHPLRSTSLTIGAGFLWAGATTVLSTSAKVDARAAALIVGRLILRLAEFVPLLNAPIPWVEVMAGLLRVSYVYDVIRALRSVQGGPALSDDQEREIMTATSMAINTFRDDWFELLIDEIARHSGQPGTTVEAWWRRHAYASESMLYLQLGSPENIWLVDNYDTPWPLPEPPAAPSVAETCVPERPQST